MDSSRAKPLKKRLFIAIKPSLTPALLDIYSTLKKNLGIQGINWVSPENFHITIKFLGETPELYINFIVSAIKSSVNHISPFNISLKSVGYFGKSQPKVLWVGIKPDYNLESIYNQLEQNLYNLGIEKENRKFSPHLTLCRIKTKIELNKLKEIIRPYEQIPFQTETINRILIFESNLNQSSVEYNVVKAIKF
jgi:RNA 2',3'-cyclic 3'-phosphodiesterase